VSVAYLDSSAFVKTIVEEPESRRLLSWLPGWPDRASSELLRVEALRSVRAHGRETVARARDELGGVDLIPVDRPILDAAADLPVEVRSLDAIHLASALALGRDLGIVVTYDQRMQHAAQNLGLPIAAP
jgi:predicted nucleic acid-binding protein